MMVVRGAVPLLALLLSAACGKGQEDANGTKPVSFARMSTITISVDGMSCHRCASRVQRTLAALDGVGDAEVSLEQKRVVIHFDPHRTSAGELASAIDEAGFKAGMSSEVAR